MLININCTACNDTIILIYKYNSSKYKFIKEDKCVFLHIFISTTPSSRRSLTKKVIQNRDKLSIWQMQILYVLSLQKNISYKLLNAIEKDTYENCQIKKSRFCLPRHLCH